MNKKPLIIGMAALAVIAAAINGCSIEQELPTVPVERSADQHIELVKGFFESQIGPLALPDTRVRDVAGAATRSTDETAPGLADAVEPDWERATMWETDNGVVTEAPAKLKKSVDYTVLVEKSGRQVSLTTQKPNVRVLVVEPRDGGVTCCMLATFLPDEGWGGKARELAVGGKPGDYSGILVYSLPDGTPAWGLRYDGGEANHIVLFDDSHADRQDPDIHIAIGSSGGALTRAQDEKYTAIEEVYCVASAEGTKRGFWEEYDELKGGGPGSFGDGGRGGGNGGNGKPTVIPPVTVNAKKIFKNKDLTEAQWKELEKMIKDILIDCMGSSLYNELVRELEGGKFQLTVNNNPLYGGGFSLSGGITISDSYSGSLFHEIFHGFQAYQETETSFKNSSANRELEAYLAEYMFSGELTGGNSFDSEVEYLFDRYLTKKGTLKDPSMEFLFNDAFKLVANHIKTVYESKYGNPTPYDPLRTGTRSIANIRHLAQNC